MTDLEMPKEKLQSLGLKVTWQRLNILEILQEEDLPLSAQEIYSRIKEYNSELRLSTVYRNLNKFTEKNIVRKLNLGKKNYFEISEKHHHHIICIKCGEIKPLDCPLGQYLEELESNFNYEIVDHSLKIYGICPDCR